MTMLALRGATMTLAPTTAAAVLNPLYALCVTHIIIIAVVERRRGADGDGQASGKAPRRRVERKQPARDSRENKSDRSSTHNVHTHTHAIYIYIYINVCVHVRQ